MGRVLILQHSLADSLGQLEEILHVYMLEPEILYLVEQPLPTTLDYDAIMILGGDQSINDIDRYSYLAREVTFLRQAIEKDVPCLGICLGAQLLAHVLGAIVKPGKNMEFGFSTIHLTEMGMQDPLFQGLPEVVQVFHWHQDTFDLPSDAILLSHNRQQEPQGFRYGQHIYGIQHHIELTPGMIRVWLQKAAHDRELLQSLGNNILSVVAVEQGNQYPLYSIHSQLLFENFLSIPGLAG